MIAEPPSPPIPQPSVAEDLEHRRGGWGELLRNPRFLLLEFSGAFAGAGYAVYSVSVLFLAYGLTRNLLIAGIVLFLEYGIYTLTFLFAPLVDRARDKRTVLLACFPVQAGAAAALAIGLRTGHLSVAALLGLVAVLAVMWDLVWAVYMIAPRIILEPRLLFAADGVSSAFSVGTQLGGYAGGGALLFLVGPDGGAFAYTVLLVLAMATAVPLSLAVAAAPNARLRETFARGWDAFRGAAGRSMRALAGVEIAVGFFAAVPVLLIPAIAYQRFAEPSAVYGVLVTIYALGGAAGGIVVGHVNPRRSVGRLLVSTPVAMGVLLFALAYLPASVLPIAAALAGVGAGGTVRYTSKYSWVRASFPTEMLGRLISNLYLFTGVAGSIAVLLVGLVSPETGLPGLIVLDAGGLIVAGIASAAIPFVRRMAF